VERKKRNEIINDLIRKKCIYLALIYLAKLRGPQRGGKPAAI
jgi:hypothetical protein